MIELVIRGETLAEVLHDLRGLGEVGSLATLVSGVAPSAPDPEPAPPTEKPNGAEPAPAPTKATKAKKAAAAPAPEPLDRAAIIDGLTKIYSKGDEDVRLAITKFRDGQGADRLRDLKDDALPAAAALLTELKSVAESPAV